MSYIDCINHSHVGSFAELPVYHPLETIDEEGKDEFTATPRNLVIGGGSGEHPGLIVKNLDACVWHFIEFIAETMGKEIDDLPFYSNWMDSLSMEESENYNVYENLHFAHWGMTQTHKFTEKVNKLYDEAVYLCCDNKDLLRKSPEEKIQIMLGEFIFFSAPQLMSDALMEYLQANKDVLKAEHLHNQAPFEALRVSPKGYPGILGRCLINDDQGGTTVKWGLRFDEEHLIDQTINNPDRNKKKKMRI